MSDGCMSLFRSSYRRAVFLALTKFFLVFGFHVQNHFHQCSNGNSRKQIDMVKAGENLCKRCADFIQKGRKLFLKSLSLCNSVGKCKLVSSVSEDSIWQIGKYYFLDFFAVNLHCHTSAKYNRNVPLARFLNISSHILL